MKPVVDRLEKRFEGKVEVRRYNVETDQQANDLARKVGVTAVPTFVFVNGNGIEAGRSVGVVSEDRMAASMEALK